MFELSEIFTITRPNYILIIEMSGGGGGYYCEILRLQIQQQFPNCSYDIIECYQPVQQPQHFPAQCYQLLCCIFRIFPIRSRGLTTKPSKLKD